MKSTELVTEQHIESWKQKHGEIFLYEADGMSCYLKRPGRSVISAAVSTAHSDPVKFAEIILNNCWLGGEELLRTDDRYFMGLQRQLSELVEVKVGKLKKL